MKVIVDPLHRLKLSYKECLTWNASRKCLITIIIILIHFSLQCYAWNIRKNLARKVRRLSFSKKQFKSEVMYSERVRTAGGVTSPTAVTLTCSPSWLLDCDTSFVTGYIVLYKSPFPRDQLFYLLVTYYSANLGVSVFNPPICMFWNLSHVPPTRSLSGAYIFNK